MMRKWLRLIGLSVVMFGFIFGLWTPISSAHGNVSVAYSDISIENGVIKYVLQLDMYDMIAEVNPDDPDINLSTPEVLNQFFSKYPTEIATDLLSKIKLYADNLPLEGKVKQLRYIEKENEVQPFAEVVLEYPVRNMPQQFALDYNLIFDKDQWHVNYVNINLGDLKKDAVFIAQLHELQIGKMSMQYTIKHFFLLGLEHPLAFFETILLVLALLIGCKTVKQTLGVVAAFAATHSITLILSGLHILVLPERFIASVVALSVVYLALNTLLNQNRKYLLWIAGILGLIHGLGFATALSGMREDGGHLGISVMAFYAGSEVALALIVLILYPAIHYARKIKRLIPVLLATIAVIGLVSFVVRAYL